MGYFKPKLRRSTAAKAARRLGAASPSGRAGERFAAGRSPPVAGFVRLSIGDGNDSLFRAAYALRDDPSLPAGDAAELAAALRWFEQRLTPHAPAEPAAIFWFKADAAEHVRQIWTLVRMLQRHGRDVRMWSARRVPGRIVFEDPFQVAAVTYRDARVTGKSLPDTVRSKSIRQTD